MQLLSTDSKSTTFTFVHNQSYQTIERKYLQAVASSVPENIVVSYHKRAASSYHWCSSTIFLYEYDKT